MSRIAERSPTRVAVPVPGETRILVEDVPWGLYEAFVDALPEGSQVRLAYDGKDLEVMTTGPLHDDYADLLDAFFKAVAGALGIRFKPQSQTTWKRPDIQKGIEELAEMGGEFRKRHTSRPERCPRGVHNRVFEIRVRRPDPQSNLTRPCHATEILSSSRNLSGRDPRCGAAIAMFSAIAVQVNGKAAV